MASPTAQNVGLGLLAAVAAGLSAFAVWHVQQPHESLATAPPPPRAVVPTPAPATGAGETAPTEENGRATGAPPASAADDDAADPTQQPYPDTGPVTVETWTQAWADDQSDLLVVGDGHSNLDSQWVQVWAEATAEERPVELSHWGEAADVEFNEPLTLSDGDGPLLRVWSASRAGSTIADAADRAELFLETSPSPRAVLISLGLSSGEEDVDAAMDQLLSELPEVPVLVAVGPRASYPEGVADAIYDWTEQDPGRVAVIDLRDMEPSEPGPQEWAAAFQTELGAAAGR